MGTQRPPETTCLRELADSPTGGSLVQDCMRPAADYGVVSIETGDAVAEAVLGRYAVYADHEVAR